MGATTLAKKDQPIFYIYEHWRPYKNECFWVGKGHGRRAYEFSKRNMRHKHIVGYLRKIGLEPEVRIISTGMTEQESLDLEIIWIRFWRDQGAILANVTDGGEGVTGSTHSEETKALIREKRAQQERRPCSPETREKIAATQRGRKKGPNPEHSARLKGRKLSEEHRRKIGEAGKGRIVSEETRARTAASNRGQKRDEATRLLLRLSHLGKTQSEETRARKSASLRLAWAKRKEAANG